MSSHWELSKWETDDKLNAGTRYLAGTGAPAVLRTKPFFYGVIIVGLWSFARKRAGAAWGLSGEAGPLRDRPRARQGRDGRGLPREGPSDRPSGRAQDDPRGTRR